MYKYLNKLVIVRSPIYTFCKWLFQQLASLFSLNLFYNGRTSQRICAFICLLTLCSTLDFDSQKKGLWNIHEYELSICLLLFKAALFPLGITWWISQLPCERFSCFTNSQTDMIFMLLAHSHSVGSLWRKGDWCKNPSPYIWKRKMLTDQHCWYFENGMKWGRVQWTLGSSQDNRKYGNLSQTSVWPPTPKGDGRGNASLWSKYFRNIPSEFKKTL